MEKARASPQPRSSWASVPEFVLKSAGALERLGIAVVIGLGQADLVIRFGARGTTARSRATGTGRLSGKI